MNPYQHRKFNALYEQHLNALRRQGHSASTIDIYSRAVRRITEYFDRSPHKLNADQLCEYFDWLIANYSWSTVKVDRNGLQFFYRYVLDKEWRWVDMVRPPIKKTLPDILSRDEVLALINATRELRYQTFFLLGFSSGMRLGEILCLKVCDVDTAHHRLHVRQAKGNKDRYVPLSDLALEALRRLWQSHCNPVWLFPSGQSAAKRAASIKSMPHGSTQKAVKKIAADAGLHKPVTPHVLRHSFGACLTEDGLSLRAIQEAMGHASPVTTARYTQITDAAQQNTQDYVNALVGDFKIEWGV